MELKNVFGRDNENYDELRPRYSDELFRYIMERTNGKNALEIGSGSGQATESFLKSGYAVTCCEINENFCNVLAERYKKYNITVANKAFEDFSCEENSFDLIFSATAFHWIDKDAGFLKIKRLLKKGGTAALFWNVPTPAYNSKALHDEIQAAYGSDRPFGYFQKYGFCTEYFEKYGFDGIESALFKAYRRLSADRYLMLLNTYSDHILIEEAKRKRLYEDIHSAVVKHGGFIDIEDNMELYIARG